MRALWCNLDQRWTSPDPVQEGDSTLVCSTCGEPYSCHECGFEVDVAGACVRPPEMGVCTSSVIPWKE